MADNKVKSVLKKPWTNTQTSFCKSLAEKSMSQSVMHLLAHRKAWWVNLGFVLPTIILSLLSGSANTSQNSLVALWPEADQEHISRILPLGLGVVGLIVSVLNSVHSFLGVARAVESHYSSHVGFSKLYRQISAEIQLPPGERSCSGSEAINSFRSQYDQLIENSPAISFKIERKFSKRRDVRREKISVPPSIKMLSVRTYEQFELDQLKRKADEGIPPKKMIRPPPLTKTFTRPNLNPKTKTRMQTPEPSKSKSHPPDFASAGRTAFQARNTKFTQSVSARLDKLQSQQQHSKSPFPQNEPPRPGVSRDSRAKKALKSELKDIPMGRVGSIAMMAEKDGLFGASGSSSSSDDDSAESPGSLDSAAKAVDILNRTGALEFHDGDHSDHSDDGDHTHDADYTDDAEENNIDAKMF